MAQRPRILVISFSNISADSRVLREISAVAKHGRITTVGYGPKPAGSDEHLQIPDNAKSLPQTPLGVAKLALRRLDSVEYDVPGAKAAIELIGNRTFDLVIANDARALPLAFAVRGDAPVWGDIHEWAPEERTHVRVWKWFVSPLMDHLCQKYLPQCGAVSTVSSEFAKLYHSHYGVDATIVRNASPFVELSPSPTSEDGTTRLVHSGAAIFGRNIEAMISAVIEAGEKYTLDLYLVPANDGGAYLKVLREVAQDNPRIRFRDPVKPQELSKTLNKYDVGIHWLPPYSPNAVLTLPNKIFDYVQARLGVAFGPTLEMVRIVEKYGIGLISAGFSQEDIVNTLRSITSADVVAWKNASHAAAAELSFENEEAKIDQLVSSLLR